MTTTPDPRLVPCPHCGLHHLPNNLKPTLEHHHDAYGNHTHSSTLGYSCPNYLCRRLLTDPNKKLLPKRE